MTSLRVRNSTRDTVLVECGSVADTTWTRVIGLLRHSSLPAGDGLLIVPCNSIHSFWMKFEFDAAFLDRDNRVVYQVKNMKRSRISKMIWRAHSVLELPAGTLAATQTATGDQLLIERR